MDPNKTKRRLTAILAADVVGYSRLMSEQEERTLRVLTHHLDIYRQLIPQFSGRVFGEAGDSVIAEFPSAVEAVRCAVEIQQTISRHNESVPADERMMSRIGVSVGDVIVDEDNLMGECVNIAARLEGEADPCCIAISSDVYHQVHNKIQVGYRDLGRRALKNIPEPVHVYLINPEQTGEPASRISNSHKQAGRYAKYLALLAVVIVVIAAILAWISWQDSTHTTASKDMSIAVMPFVNMSGDPKQEYFVDGITEDIITNFSRLSHLTVIAWNTSSSYKGESINPQQIGTDLGVGYLLEGSVRKSGDRLRITARLLDTDDGNHVWAERYDRDVTEIFTLQDEVTKKIVDALAIRMTTAEKSKLGHSDTRNLEAYDIFLRGQQFSLERSKEGNEQAREAFRQAIELDPAFARAYGSLAVAIIRDHRYGWSDLLKEESRYRALGLAQKAVALDRSTPQVYWSLGYVHLNREEYEEAAAAAQRSVEIAPNYADGYALLAFIKYSQGNAEEAIRYTQKAMQLNPYYTYEYPLNLGRANYSLGRYAEAEKYLKKAIEHNENALFPRLFLAATYIRLGRDDDAKWEIEQVEINSPGASITHITAAYPGSDQVQMQALLEDLRKAGLKE
jgi:adenylate cyclase